MFRKMAVLGSMVLVVMMVAQPAMAGVGGCRPLPGVGGCWQLSTTTTPTSFVPVLLDSMRGAVPADLIAAAKALHEGRQSQEQKPTIAQPGDTTTQGVGGCRPLPGVGGCWQ